MTDLVLPETYGPLCSWQDVYCCCSSDHCRISVGSDFDDNVEEVTMDVSDVLGVVVIVVAEVVTIAALVVAVFATRKT